MPRMRLAGSIPRTLPRIFIFTADGTFYKSDYPDYTKFDVICIGAGGSRGGGYFGEDSGHAGNTIRTIGGEGGGGGFHRVQGLLEALDDGINYSVGVAGDAGVDHDDLGSITDGTDGTASSFGDFVVASGGNAGKKSISDSIDNATGADGGDGGLGGQGEHGWGGKGGVAGITDDPEAVGDTPAVAGVDGFLRQGPYEFTSGFFTLPGLIGQGGGGGVGGLGLLISGDTTYVSRFPFAARGGRGAYDLDEMVYGPGSDPLLDSETGLFIVSGKGGGARTTPLTNSWRPYGTSGMPGVVVIRLTVE